MSVVCWAALIWFAAPLAFVCGAVTTLLTQTRSGTGQPWAAVIAAAAPWSLIATPLFNGRRSWLLVLLTAWSAGCLVALLAVRWRDT